MLNFYNVVYHQSAYTINRPTFSTYRDLLTQLLYNNKRKSFRFYIASFVRGLSNLLTGSYIIPSLSIIAIVL